MKKCIIGLVLTFSLVLAASSAYSQEMFGKTPGGYARIYSLGAGGFGMMMNDAVSYSSYQYLIDPTNIIVNPAWVSTYRNTAWGSINSNANAFINANLALSDNFVVGLIASNNGLFGMNAISTFPLEDLVQSGSVTLPVIKNNYQLIGALKIQNATIGLGVNYMSNTTEDKPHSGTNTETSLSQFGFNIGTLIEINENFMIDGAICLALPSYTNKTGSTESTMSGSLFSLNVRTPIKANDNFMMFPFVDFYTASGSSKSGSTTNDLMSVTSIDFGYGINYKIDNLLFVGGLSMGMYSQTTPKVDNINPEQTNSQLVFPRWNLGMEYGINNWLTARVGYSNLTASETTQTPSGVNDVNENIQTKYNLYYSGGFSFGMGFKFGKFSIDATVYEEALTAGFANFGGTIPTFGLLSVYYDIK